MTLHRIEHAVVMDTGDDPGRGGNFVLGISSGVSQSERAFVSGNFGISDYLLDPRTEKRIFYSAFRVPGGRRAFMRRFARGVRRGQTHNRLFIHTLFLDDEVDRSLHGLPWLLVNASVRTEGMTKWDRLRDDLPWVPEGSTIPSLEWDSSDGATDDVVARFHRRLTAIGKLPQLPAGASSPSDFIARIIGALSGRVVLPQGSAYEMATLLAWSMLPPNDREDFAWTQHDSSNISGVTFQLANALIADGQATNLDAPAASFAEWLVQSNTASEESWRDFHHGAAKLQLTVRKGQHILAWQQWQDACEHLRASVRHQPESEIIEVMERLAATAKYDPDAPWIDGREVLEMIWACVTDDVRRGNLAERVVREWVRRLDRSRLGDVVFRVKPSVPWLARAANDVGADALVRFFLLGTGFDPGTQATLATVAEWAIQQKGEVSPRSLALLAVRLAEDRATILREVLEHLFAAEDGLEVLHAHIHERKDVRKLVFEAVPIVLRLRPAGTLAFLREIFAPLVDTKTKVELAEDVAEMLRDDPHAFLGFASRLAPEVSAHLMDLVTRWMFREPARTRPLAGAILHHARRLDTIRIAGPLAIALANAGEPAETWFRVVLEMALATDAKNHAAATQTFLGMLKRIERRPLQLDGAMGPLLHVLESDAKTRAAGDCVRAAILLVRPVWNSAGGAFPAMLARLVAQQHPVSSWQEIVAAVVADVGPAFPADTSTLVTAFWMRVDPPQVPNVLPVAIDALTFCTAADRRHLGDVWQTRLKSLPPSTNSERLLEMLLGGDVALPGEVRMKLARRSLEQGTISALNVLDTGLHARHGERYVDEMARQIEVWLGEGSVTRRMSRLIEIFRSAEVQQTVKLVAERHVLPKFLAALRPSQWHHLLYTLRPEDLLAHGVPALELARRAAAVANRGTIERFKKVYAAHDRSDALASAAVGRSLRRWWRPVQR